MIIGEKKSGHTCVNGEIESNEHRVDDGFNVYVVKENKGTSQTEEECTVF